jgi:uncharacterized protein (DUF1330 family)
MSARVTPCCARCRARWRAPAIGDGVVHRVVAEIQRRHFLPPEFGDGKARRSDGILAGIVAVFAGEARLPALRSRGGKVSNALTRRKGAYATGEGNIMNKLTLLAGIAIGAVLTAGIAQLQAQAPAPANTTRPAIFVITEQTITDQDRYEKEFAPAAIKTIKDSGGRFIVRGGEVTSLAGDAPKRVVITGWESLDDVKKWQAGEYGKLIALRDQVAKIRQFAVATCENPQGAKPGQTKCP